MRQAASSSRRPTASNSSRGRSRSTTTRRRAATRCSRTSCSGWARIWGDDELERRAVSVLRLVRDALPKAPTAFGWLLVALDQYLAPHRELAIIGAPTTRSRAWRSRAPSATDVVAFGPADDIPLLAGRGKGRRAPDALCLPRFRLRPARHRTRLSSSAMALLEIRDVTRRFGGIVAIDDVSLDVDAGQIVGLIGPNGAGKTTLFNVITRLYKPDAGAVAFDGQEPAAHAAAPRRPARASRARSRTSSCSGR